MCKNFPMGKILGAGKPVWLKQREVGGVRLVQDEIRAGGSGQIMQGLQHGGNDLGRQP